MAREEPARPAALPLVRDLAFTLATGLAAGGLLVGGIVALRLEGVHALLDIAGDGLDLRDALVVMAGFGHMAVLVRYVLPGLFAS